MSDGTEDTLRALGAALPGYAPELAPAPGTAAAALLRVVARYLDILAEDVRAADDRGRVAFHDAYGASLLTAQSARAPVVFTLLPGTTFDVDVPAHTEVSAEGRADVVFATSTPLAVARAGLRAVYSVDPEADAFADHAAPSEPFSFFGEMDRCEHALYLGHDRLFALRGDGDVIISFQALGADRDRLELDIAWEYLSEDGFRAFDNPSLERLAADGQIVLRKRGGPPAKQAELFGRKSFWIRGRLRSPLPPAGVDGLGGVPTLDDLRVRVRLDTGGLVPDALFRDAVPLDAANGFLPFGEAPRRYTTLYIASRDAFSRNGARVRLEIAFDGPGGDAASDTPGLAWEYHDGHRWKPLGVDDATRGFTDDGTRRPVRTNHAWIAFTCPSDVGEATVNAVKSLWIRAILTVDDLYGAPPTFRIEDGAVVRAGGFTPPRIRRLTVGYSYSTDPDAADHVFAVNDFVTVDHTLSSRWPRRRFAPFVPVSDRSPAIYFGFDERLPIGLVSLFFSAGERDDDDEDRASPFTWEYLTERGWTELGVEDETRGFVRTGVIQFAGPWDAIPSDGVGGRLYRIRARLKHGARPTPRPARGLWHNATWARQERAHVRELLDVSDGRPRAVFLVRPESTPILEGERVEVREWTGRGAGWELAVEGVPTEDLRFDRDPGGDVLAVWVRWHARPHLLASGAGDRHYTIERSTGRIQLGDGEHGLIPPAGAQVVISHASGGGLSGNVARGAIQTMRAALPFVSGVRNPIPAAGGAPTEPLASLLARAPHRFRHQDRAVTPADYEAIARGATSLIARARCLATTGPAGAVQPGWVTLVVVPRDDGAAPALDAEIARRVTEHLAACVPATVASRLRVIGPTYLPITVVAEVVPRRGEDPALVERRLREALRSFLHPTTGGPRGDGWDFGEGVYLSTIAALVERAEGVDYAARVGLRVEGEAFGEVVPGRPDAIVCSGDHEIRITLGAEC